MFGSGNPVGSLLGVAKGRRALACTRMFVKGGEHLYLSGDPISSIYTILAGTFKTCTVTEKGKVQVMGFYMRGATMGLDAIATGYYSASAIALEDSQVCVVSAERLEQHCLQNKSVPKRLHAAMAWEINARQRVILMLGSKTAIERVASFLIEHAATYFELGRSFFDMHLVMNRDEIGSYLGLTLETVSRILSNFQDRQLLVVNQRRVRILDFAGLQQLTG